MKKVRSLGGIDNNGESHMRSSLLTIIPHDEAPAFRLTLRAGRGSAVCPIIFPH